ncbi:hypothetical protein AVEN_87321-1 [Araneus ventricosus]|uniref:Uncharacterized protein n=1 Tax=Araneus ventricosus TaxID=182803 RepID=A0A4Y2VML6_ARAVE|nr:hypothetical protein AVEN_87321-1 [Araneus ventricosus]
MALISIVYRLSNRRVVSSRVLVLRNQTNVFHPASSSSLRSRPLHPLTSLAMAAPSAVAGGPQYVLRMLKDMAKIWGCFDDSMGHPYTQESNL